MKKTLALVALFLIGLAGMLTAGVKTGAVGAATAVVPNRVTLTCAFQPAGRAQVDSIVSPGVTPSAHMHDFYGRRDISNYMLARAFWPPFRNDPGYAPVITSCRNYGDWAAYWFPTPKFNGTFILSGDLQNTWQSPGGSIVAAPPFGMAYVAGPGANARFTCGGLDEVGSATPMDCTGIGTVTAELKFPNCWDGAETLGAEIHAGIKPTHFAYGEPCAPNWTRIAQLITRQHFIDPRTGTVMVNPFNADGTLGLSFSSGAPNTYHGDFLNSWNIGLRDYVVNRCLNLNGYPCPVFQ